MNRWSLITDPWHGKTSLAKVVWGYGLLGSLGYGALELFLDPGNPWEMGIYNGGGLLFSVYVAVATYRCARNCASKFWGRLAQISAVLSVLVLPLVAYLEYTGALSLALLGEQ